MNLKAAAALVLAAQGASDIRHRRCEVRVTGIDSDRDLRTIVPWDVGTVVASVQKTGRAIQVVSHDSESEALVTMGFGADSEVAAAAIGSAERAFLSLEAPVQRVCGFDTPFPLAYELHYVPHALRVLEAIKTTRTVKY